MQKLGDLTLELELDDALLGSGLAKAQQKTESGVKGLQESFDQLEKGVDDFNQLIAEKLTKGAKDAAKSATEDLPSIELDPAKLLDFRTGSGVDLSPLTEEIERLKTELVFPFPLDFPSRLLQSPSDREDDRTQERDEELTRRTSRSISDSQDDQERQLSSAERRRASTNYGIQPDQSTNARRSQSRRESKIDEHGGDIVRERRTPFSEQDLPEIILPYLVDPQSIEVLTRFFNQSDNINASTSSLVGFVNAWNVLLTNPNATAESLKLHQQVLDSIRSTMNSLDTTELESVTSYLNQSEPDVVDTRDFNKFGQDSNHISSSIDVTSSSLNRFVEQWNRAVERSKNPDLANQVVRTIDVIQEEAFEAEKALQEARERAIQNTRGFGEGNTASRLGRGLASANDLFNALSLEPRFRGGPVQAGKDYSVAEQGPELGLFGDQSYLFKTPQALKPRQDGYIFNRQLTKRVLNSTASMELKITSSQQFRGSEIKIVSELKQLRQCIRSAIAQVGNTYKLDGGDVGLDQVANLRMIEAKNLATKRRAT